MGENRISYNDENVFRYIGSLYPTPFRALIEFFTNPRDAMKNSELKKYRPKNGILNIRLTVLPKGLELTTNAPGMNIVMIRNILGNVADSFKASMQDTTGEFGIGMLAFQRFSEKLTFITRLSMEDRTHWFELYIGNLFYNLGTIEDPAKQLPYPGSKLIFTFGNQYRNLNPYKQGGSEFSPSRLAKKLAWHYQDLLKPEKLRLVVVDKEGVEYPVKQPSIKGVPLPQANYKPISFGSFGENFKLDLRYVNEGGANIEICQGGEPVHDDFRTLVKSYPRLEKIISEKLPTFRDHLVGHRIHVHGLPMTPARVAFAASSAQDKFVRRLTAQLIEADREARDLAAAIREKNLSSINEEVIKRVNEILSSPSFRKLQLRYVPRKVREDIGQTRGKRITVLEEGEKRKKQRRSKRGIKRGPRVVAVDFRLVQLRDRSVHYEFVGYEVLINQNHPHYRVWSTEKKTTPRRSPLVDYLSTCIAAAIISRNFESKESKALTEYLLTFILSFFEKMYQSAK